MSSLQLIQRELKSRADKGRAIISQRFFKTAPGQYGAGDIFLGLTVPMQREIASRYPDLSLSDIRALLSSPTHEFRLSALLILVRQYEVAPSLAAKKKIADFYYRVRRRINNWDLVDLSAPNILGNYLLLSGQGIALLLKMADSKNLWDRRIAIIATLAFIKAGRYEEAFALAEKLINDRHDLIHKAIGWMLREVGKRISEAKLRQFLNRQAARLPRTALRYAIEHLDQNRRQHYLSIKKSAII